MAVAAVELPNHLASRSRRGVVVAARIGYSAKGVVYAVLGVLSLLAAFGDADGRLTDSKGAIQAIGKQPFGEFLLWATALGLLCYAVWKGVCAALDPEHKGSDGKGVVKRVGYGIISLLHLGLALYAAELAYGSGSSSGSGSRGWVSSVLSLPLGRVLLGVAGAVIVGVGVAEVVKAAKGKVGHQYASAPLDARLCRAVRRLARVGVFARGLVFPVIGISLLTAAWREDAGDAEGFGEALGEFARQPFGMWLLSFVASGLLAYALHLFFVARYGHLPEPRWARAPSHQREANTARVGRCSHVQRANIRAYSAKRGGTEPHVTDRTVPSAGALQPLDQSQAVRGRARPLRRRT